MTINVAEKSAELNAAWPAPEGAEWKLISETDHTLQWQCETKGAVMLAACGPALGRAAWMLTVRCLWLSYSDDGRSAVEAHAGLKRRYNEDMAFRLPLGVALGVEVLA
jgi:hypothetical protein